MLYTVFIFLALIFPDPPFLGNDNPYVIKEIKTRNNIVNAVCFSPNDEKLAYGGEDHLVRLINLTTEDIVYELEGHFRAVHDLVYSRNGEYLISAGDNSLRIWNTSNGELSEILTGHHTDIWSVAVSPNMEQLASGAYSKKFRVWDMHAEEKEIEMEGHDKSVLSVAYSPDGKYIASGSLDRTIMIWDAHTLKPIYVIEAHADNIMDLDFSPDSRYLASASLDNTIKIWDVKTGEIVRVLTGHEGGVSSIDFSPDGKHLISGSVDLSIRLWEASNGHVIYTYAHHDAPINCVRYNHAGDQFVSAAQDEKILIWKLTKDVFVNYYFEADITHEINESPLFLPRQNNESRDEYKARQEEAEEFKNELFDKYYQKYLDMKEEQSITP